MEASMSSNTTTQTIRRGVFITTITRPVLTDTERAKRMDAIKQAAVELVTAAEVSKARKTV
jgi:hypothetical protein